MTKIRAQTALTSEGWLSDVDVVVAENGRIASVGPQSGVAEKTVDLLLPAPTNLHSHSFQRIIAGLTEAKGPDESDSFWTWRKLMYHNLLKLTPEHIEVIAAQAFMEMAEASYAAVAEFHYIHHPRNGQFYDNIAELAERIVGAAEYVGLGLTLLPVLYEFGGCDGRALQGGQIRFGNSKDQFAKLFSASQTLVANGQPDCIIGVAPHSLRAVDTDGLRLALDLTGGGPFHMHLAEQIAEVDEVKAHMGARPVEWVLNNMPIDERSCFIHCTQMIESETAGLAASGAVSGLCPITESNLGDGIFDGIRYLTANGAFGIGSDSNIYISFWDELKTLEYSQRLRDRGRAMFATQTQSAGRVLYEYSLAGGAKAAGRSSGALEVDMWADMIAVSTDNEFLCSRRGDTLLDSLIFSGGVQKSTTDVWSAGRHIVQDGRHAKREQIVQRFVSVMKELELGI
ncbi:MAG: formimidoylglutamate deiminase [Aestuariivita sp.]|nr:formimidoylglutamate deiminase [Aestuariivita sp.]